jgi:signal transduction histidine kinase
LSGTDLEVSISEDLPMVKGSLRKLQQVFFNLLMNAVQATSKGGTVRISVHFSKISGFLAFVVEDNGVGIPREEQHKLFEPFYTTKVTGEGTGLGLAVCYSIVKQHGGRVEVESERGQGAQFTVLLPAVPKDFLNWSGAGSTSSPLLMMRKLFADALPMPCQRRSMRWRPS